MTPKEIAAKHRNDYEKTIAKKTVEKNQYVLYFQFDDDEPILGMNESANSFSLNLSENCTNIEFTNGTKKFKIFIKANN